MASEKKAIISPAEEQLGITLSQHNFGELKKRAERLAVEISGLGRLNSYLKPLSPNENFVLSIGNALEYFSNNKIDRHDEICDALRNLLKTVSIENLATVAKLASQVPGARSELVTVLSTGYSS